MIEQAANHLWQSTLVAALAGLLTLAFRNNRAQVRYWLWLAASLKFLIPFAALTALGGQFGWLVPVRLVRVEMNVVTDAVTRNLSQAEIGAVAAASTAPPSVVASLPVLLLAIWFAGGALLLAAWCVRWWRISSAVRRTTAITNGRELDILRRLERCGGISRPIALLASDGSPEPGVFGILRPVLLWPSGVGARLGDAQVEAILAHELTHVRRRDNLAAAIHMIVQAVFWFHPLVWWVGARLVDERERACDEEVIRLGSEPQVYAESILKTCALCVESPLACVSGVTGADLKRRIETIMRNRSADPLHAAKKIFLATACASAIVGPVALGAVSAPHPQAYSAADESFASGHLQRSIEDLHLRARTIPLAAPRAFEAVSIKPNTSGGAWRIQALMSRSRSAATPVSGQVTLTNMPLREVIRLAYGLQPFQVSGGPEWIHSTGYDIVVKGDVPTGSDHMGLLRTLLTDRFKLRVHHEPRELSVFELVRANSDGTLGPRLRPSEVDCSSPPPGVPACAMWRYGISRISARGVTMEQLAMHMTSVSHRVNRAVLDRTGLTGTFDLDLEFLRPLDEAVAHFPPMTAALERLGLMTSFFTAVRQQLGLQLNPEKGPVDLLVIDGAEQPNGN
jgi:bla regulator protein blaR1